MKKIVLAGLIAVIAVLVTAPPGDAGGRHHRHGFRSRVVIGIGPSVHWGPYPYWYYPPPAYVYAPPPLVVQEAPPVYVQQTPPPPPTAAPEQYWYYCESAGGYYPTVPSCPEAWVKVPPRP
ncbi:MAG: hypothetical protein FJ027_04610 [Candidatus Rokubacteria bacterium]|nr:hypothetical protein [Candidatus Rokubacteria bacterium]